MMKRFAAVVLAAVLGLGVFSLAAPADAAGQLGTTVCQTDPTFRNQVCLDVYWVHTANGGVRLNDIQTDTYDSPQQHYAKYHVNSIKFYWAGGTIAWQEGRIDPIYVGDGTTDYYTYQHFDQSGPSINSTTGYVIADITVDTGYHVVQRAPVG